MLINEPTLSERKSLDDKLIVKDWNYSIQLNRLFLKSIGAWPLSLTVTLFDKIISISLTTISICLIGFLFLPCALVTFLGKENDLDAKIKMIGPFSFCAMAAIKYYILTSRGLDIAKCIKHIRTDWEHVSNAKNNNRKIMIDNAEFGRSLVISCAIFMYGGGIFYCTIMPLCSKRTEMIDNETIRVPSFPIYRKLIDPRTSPYFEIVQFLQCLAGYVIYSVTISACSLLCIFVMHACGQFKILKTKLDDLVVNYKENHSNSSNKLFGDIVEYHLRILDFISRIEELFNEICFVELVGCTMNICFLGYYLMTEWEHNETIGTLTYCTLLISFIFNIFILCYIGELLVEQCENVGLTSYMINWYSLPKRKALDLTILIAVSNTPLKLTAGKLFDLSLASFCSVIKSATAYLNLLRTLTN